MNHPAKIKRTCNDCRALRYNEIGVSCSLGYGNERTHDEYTGDLVKPTEPCPKPYSKHDYILAERNKKNA